MKSLACCLCIRLCLPVYPPLFLLGGLRDQLAVCTSPPPPNFFFRFVCGLCRINEAYDIALLSSQ
jgi:hypothetical protein